MGCGFNLVATTEQRTNGRAFIADKLQMQGGGGHNGLPYEINISKMHYIAAQTGNPMSIVALSVSLSSD